MSQYAKVGAMLMQVLIYSKFNSKYKMSAKNCHSVIVLFINLKTAAQ